MSLEIGAIAVKREDEEVLVAVCDFCQKVWLTPDKEETRCNGRWHQKRRSRCGLSVVLENGKFTQKWEQLAGPVRARICEDVKREKNVEVRLLPGVTFAEVKKEEEEGPRTELSRLNYFRELSGRDLGARVSCKFELNYGATQWFRGTVVGFDPEQPGTVDINFEDGESRRGWTLATI